MVKPALIVGLGKTGRWVLTWLKRDLMQDNNGAVPDHVRLLALDADEHVEATSSHTPSDENEEAVEVDGVTLASDEWVCLGENALPGSPSIQAQRSGGEESVTSWFRADRWLSAQEPSTFIFDESAGRLRQFGRLAIFMDLTGRGSETQLWSALHSALSDAGSSACDQHPLEIIVVGSLAGGTGSGLFIDIAYLSRRSARQLEVPYALRGVFVSSSDPDDGSAAHALAALREIDRCLEEPPESISTLTQDVNDRTGVWMDPEKRLFDACYLVDDKRAGKPDSASSARELYTTLSEVIRGILAESESKP
jgi:hypothetical protein